VTGPRGELDPETCPSLPDAGVYVLGALTSCERAWYTGHLAGCAACRREVDELADLPALLRRVAASFEPLVRGGSAPPDLA
jgi:anti-sigma factor RsiW